jgi:3-(methylthio)propanoyl-CoA dehydrogenase
MMNSERLLVGIQGVAIAERAYQQAREYARTRVQGHPPPHPTLSPNGGEGRVRGRRRL